MARRLPIVLTSAEAESLVSAAHKAVNDARTPRKQFAAWRDFVMIHVGIYTGCRVSELCNLKIENLNLDGSILAILEGKGKKDRNIPIGSKLDPVLREWVGDRVTGWLFPGPKGKRLTERAFQLRLDKLAVLAGIKKKIHPHLMRHSFACSLLRSGADLREVQELLGHSNLATTAIYLHVEVSRLKAAIDRL